MTKGQKTALLVGAGILGGAALVKIKTVRGSYSESGTRGAALDFGLGALATGAVLVLADAAMSAPEEALLNPLINPLAVLKKKGSMGRTPRKAVKLLSELNDNLYDDFKGNGVKIAAVPPNPAIVNQDAQ